MKSKKTNAKELTINKKTLSKKVSRILKDVNEIDYNLPYKLDRIQFVIEDLNSRKFESVAQLKDEYSDFLFWSHKMFVIIQNKISDIEHSLEHLKRGE